MVLATLAAPAAPARADEEAVIRTEITRSVESAIESGLDALVSLQDSNTGAIGKSYRVASTALGGLALLAAGAQPGEGTYGKALEEATRFLTSETVAKRVPNGRYFLYDGEQSGQMHAHGFAMLFLAEVYGVGTPEKDEEIARILRGAIALVVDAQTDLGGWGYHHRGEVKWGEDEGSVTVTQIQALRAARDAGFAVDSRVIDDAVGYIRRSMTADGSCRYSLTMGAEGFRTSYELTAAAVSTLNASGVYGGPELERGLGYMRQEVEKARARGGKNPSAARAASSFDWYGNLYAAQAMYQVGGLEWTTWFEDVREYVVRLQKPDGSWPEGERQFGAAYSTASALLILQVPRRYLPIFQR